VKGIQVCSNKGTGRLLRGNDHKNVKMGWGHLNIFFSRTTGQIITRFGTNILEGTKFIFMHMKWIAPPQGEIIAKQ
jgi:hypothetical protein